MLDDQLRMPAVARKSALAATETLSVPIRTAVRSVLTGYGGLRQDALIEYVYDQYPWFASRSRLRPSTCQETAALAVYTIGYEGESIDHFLNRLLEARIERLIDVRKNPYSRKFGFTGGPLRRKCAKVGIDYQHLPGLGIPSEMRRDLSTRAKRTKLFCRYESEMLPLCDGDLDRAAELVAEKPSALMCMERDVDDCHRGPLARVVGKLAELGTTHL